MGISWRCARGHVTNRMDDLRYDANGKLGCMYCLEEDAGGGISRGTAEGASKEMLAKEDALTDGQSVR